MNDKNWVVNFNIDSEIWEWSESFENKKDAIEFCKKYIEKDLKEEEGRELEQHKQFQIAQRIRYQYQFDGESIWENIIDDAYEECGESSENYEPGNLDKLSEKLTKALMEWEIEEKCIPNFYRLINIETIEIKEAEKND